MPSRSRRIARGVAVLVWLVLSVIGKAQGSQKPPVAFGGAFSSLDLRRQRLVENWVQRFNKVTGQQISAGVFYDTYLKLSVKTTFEAVTHALMTTTFTDAAGAAFGDTLDVVDYIESVKGQSSDASSDHQFRIYVRLSEHALDLLARSREFKRDADNTVYHKGYPLNYREQGGTPSIQISVTPDGRRADIDVDYRSPSFPAAIFNGHLTASNSDVRSGNNFDRHTGRWNGFENWWAGFFGIALPRSPEDVEAGTAIIPPKPRAGKKPAEEMVADFLTAWLIDGDAGAAMSYVSDRALACLVLDSDEPDSTDHGMSRYVLFRLLQASHEALGPRASLAGLTAGVRLTTPGLKTVQQPHHAQFVIYAVPDDIAASFDCQSRLTTDGGKPATRTYGHYFGSIFHINGPRQDVSVALLWAKENGYWKIVSWRTEPDADDATPPEEVATAHPARVKADDSLVAATKGFLEAWLIRKDYDAAFRYLSPSSYACYDRARGPQQPAAESIEDAGRKIRDALEHAGAAVGPARDLSAVVTAAEPIHPDVRVMDHGDARVFTLSSLPTAFAEAADCARKGPGALPARDLPPEYGVAFGLTVRFRTRAGDAPVLRTMWAKEQGEWRLTGYTIEMP